MNQVKGIGVSSGFAIGTVRILHSGDVFQIARQMVPPDMVVHEMARFEDALTKTRAEILGIRKKVSNQIGSESSDIFNAHLLILEDRTLIEDVISMVKKERVQAEYAFSKVIQRYFEVFSQINDEYLKERVADIRDVGRRLLANLCGHEKFQMDRLDEPVILVSHDLSPSDTASLDRSKVLAFVTESGGPTSHTAILGRSLEIPAIVGAAGLIHQVKNGDRVIVDGSHGIVIIAPDEATVERMTQQQARFVKFRTELEKLRDLPAQTPDGRRLTLAANIEFHYEMDSVIAHGAEGIGLYRTEYFYMNRTDLPSEEEQFQAYKQVAEKMNPHGVIIRTLDLGGDKFASSLDVPNEMNPYLGCRAIRFCLTRPDIFKTQLRAILRASAHGNLLMMYPLISTVGELIKANEFLAETKQELKKEGIPFSDTLQVGAMIEIPSAALTSDILAREVDFFSIGTNDLIQYSLAVDRVNEKIAYLYQPTHPAILKLIKMVVENAHAAGKWVGSCGEMSGDPAIALLLLGLGIDELSASPVSLPKIKKAVRSIRFEDAKKIAEKALQFGTSEQIRKYLDEQVQIYCKELAEE